MPSNQPIGVFDSGVGGLSIARQIRHLLPNENLIYVADSRYAPYGDKTEAFIYQRACSIVEFLLARQVKAVVVACNTATVSCIEKLRLTYPIPFVGVEPGIKPATSASKSGVVGVLATRQTINSQGFQALIMKLAGAVRIELQACPGLMEQVEALAFNDDKTQQLLQNYVRPLLEKGADQLVLGCTHYAFLTDAIKKMAGPEVGIINTALAVAQEVARRLGQLPIASQRQLPGSDVFFTSANGYRISQQISTLWGKSTRVISSAQLLNP